MIRLRFANVVFLLIILVWIFLGLLPFRQHIEINKLQENDNLKFDAYGFQHGVQLSREQIKRLFASDDIELEELESQIYKNIKERPLLVYSWLDLAEVKYRQAELEEVNQYILKAQNLWPTSSHSLYAIASFWLKIGQIEKSIRTFGQYLNTRPSQVATVMTISSLLEPDSKRLIELLLDQNDISAANLIHITERILNHAIEKNNSQLAISTWNKYKSTLTKNVQLFNFYVKYLIHRNLIDEALSVWKFHHGSEEISEVFLNNSFESEIIQSGFGWRILKSNEFKWNIDDEIAYQGQRSLSIEFSGDNIQFQHVEQIIPVQSNALYKVSAYWRGQGVTTRSTPFIELTALHGDRKLTTRSESKRGHWGWKKLEVKIKIPASSNLLRVRVRRNTTNSLDKNIEGKVWFDDFKLEKITN